MLPLSGAIANFSLATNAQRILERMMGFALVETDLSAALHVGVENPLYKKERPLDAAGATARAANDLVA